MKFLALLAVGVVTVTGAVAQRCTKAVRVTSVVYVTSTVPPQSTPTFMNTIPEIDVCGANSNHISCPGAGPGGYFYRCCSSAGHCGPKNAEQDSAIYCGAGCQAGYGSCDPARLPPPKPSTPPTVSTDRTCGPIVNKKCPGTQCCSGSNFCGTGIDFCGAANWCQVDYGRCER